MKTYGHSYRVAVITASDKGARGERVDESGPLISEIMVSNGYRVVYSTILPDDREIIASKMRDISDDDRADIVLTTGGTGLSVRDVTPEATLDIAERRVPGIAEMMRARGTSITKRAMFSRAEAVTRKNTLIINLPGSPSAVRENLSEIVGELYHAIAIIRGDDGDCASKKGFFDRMRGE